MTTHFLVQVVARGDISMVLGAIRVLEIPVDVLFP